MHVRNLNRLDIMPGGMVYQAEFSPNGTQVLTCTGPGTCVKPNIFSEPGQARLWNADSGTAESRWIKHEGGITCIAWHPDGKRFLTAGNDRRVQVFDFASKKAEWTVNCPSLVAACCFTSASNEVSIIGHNGSVRIADSTGSRSKPYKISGRPTYALLSPGNRRLAIVAGLRVVVQSIKIAKPILMLNHRLRVTCLVWRDANCLITGSDDYKIREWDVRNGRERIICSTPRWVHSVACSRDGKRLLLGTEDKQTQIGFPGSGHACVVDMRTGRELGRKCFHDGAVLSQFMLDESKIVTGSSDRTVACWDWQTGRQLQHWEFGRMVSCLRVCPKGHQFLTAGGNLVSLFRCEKHASGSR